MQNPDPTGVSRVRATRRFRASRRRVYRAWTEPELMMKWFIDSDYEMTIVELDLRPGGAYRLEGREPDGRPWAIEGTYLEVAPEERLVYTWKWEGDKALGGPGDTVVTVEFRDLGSETELVVTQEGFTNEIARDAHDTGWIGCLDRLEEVVSRDTT